MRFWYQLIHNNGSAYNDAAVDAVLLPEEAIVVEFLEAVKQKNNTVDQLLTVSPVQLRVHASSRLMVPLASDAALDGMGLTANSPLLVVVPSKRRRGDSGPDEDFMDVDQSTRSLTPELKGECVRMDIASLLYFMQSHMLDPAKFNQAPKVLIAQQLMFPLCGRDDALKQAAASMFQIGLPAGQANKVTRKVPVCSGMSGLGKTRMLEEWSRIFDMAKIPPQRLGLLVRYDSGHRPHAIERNMTIEASFSWRLLHRCFLEGNNDFVFRDWPIDNLPINGTSMTLKLALNVIRAMSVQMKILQDHETLHVFIGVDEFQSINKVGGKLMHHPDQLQDLLALFGDYMDTPPARIRVYPMLAGTDFAAVSIANTSKTECLRMPMYLLTQADVESAVSAVEYGDDLLTYPLVRKHLFYLGGVPRWVTEYVIRLLAVMPLAGKLMLKDIEVAYIDIKAQYVESWGNSLSHMDFVNMAAWAISSIPVDATAKQIGNMTWARVRDSSLCLLNNANQVLVPYSLLLRAARYNILESGDSKYTDAMRAFVECLQQLAKQVDDSAYSMDSWQLWEVFGAHHHALRINALIVIGRDVVTLADLFSGALIKGCQQQVKLRPMIVWRTADQLSLQTGRLIRNKTNFNIKEDWLNQGYIVLNGSNGAGVDIFFALAIVDSPNKFVVITDQRKLVGGRDMSQYNATQLLQKARIVPKLPDVDVTVVSCLFSCIKTANVDAAQLPPDCVVVGYKQYGDYHGTLAAHPASCPLVKVCQDPKTYIQMLLDGQDANKRKVAENVVAHRELQAFTSSAELRQFVEQLELQVTLVEDVEVRALLY